MKMEKANKTMKKILSMFWGLLYCLPLIFMLVTYFNGTWRQDVNTSLNYNAYETYIQDVATNTNVQMFSHAYGDYLQKMEKAVLNIQDTNIQPTTPNTSSLLSAVTIKNLFFKELWLTENDGHDAVRYGTYTSTINADGSLHIDYQQESYHSTNYTTISISPNVKSYSWVDGQGNLDYYDTYKLTSTLNEMYVRNNVKNLNLYGATDISMSNCNLYLGQYDHNIGGYAYTTYHENFCPVSKTDGYGDNVYVRTLNISFKTSTQANNNLHHISFDVYPEVVEIPLIDTVGFYTPNESKNFYSNLDFTTIYQQGVADGITYKTNTLNLVTSEITVLNAVLNWYVSVVLLHIVVDALLLIPNLVKHILRKVGLKDYE